MLPAVFPPRSSSYTQLSPGPLGSIRASGSFPFNFEEVFLYFHQLLMEVLPTPFYFSSRKFAARANPLA